MRFFVFCYLLCCSMAFAYQQNVSAPNEPQGISLPPNNQIWLPELKGVVSWKTLAQVTPTKQKGKLVPEFSKEVESLNKKEIRLQGFMMPLEMGDKQKRFLLSAFPPHCSFCLTAGPDSLIEVLAKTPIKYGFEPIVLSGRFAVLKDDPAGLYYRLTEAMLLSSPQ